jgi:hypothetical protein
MGRFRSTLNPSSLLLPADDNLKYAIALLGHKPKLEDKLIGGRSLPVMVAKRAGQVDGKRMVNWSAISQRDRFWPRAATQ